MELVVKTPEKSVNGTHFHWDVSTGKTGLPFQKFRLLRKISSGTNQKVVFHLHPNRNFRNCLVNGKRSLCYRGLRFPMPLDKGNEGSVNEIIRDSVATSGNRILERRREAISVLDVAKSHHVRTKATKRDVQTLG